MHYPITSYPIAQRLFAMRRYGGCITQYKEKFFQNTILQQQIILLEVNLKKEPAISLGILFILVVSELT